MNKKLRVPCYIPSHIEILHISLQSGVSAYDNSHVKNIYFLTIQQF